MVDLSIVFCKCLPEGTVQTFPNSMGDIWSDLLPKTLQQLPPSIRGMQRVAGAAAAAETKEKAAEVL